MKKFFALYVFAVLAVAAGITSAKAGTIAHWTFEEGTPGSTAQGPAPSLILQVATMTLRLTGQPMSAVPSAATVARDSTSTVVLIQCGS